MVECCCCSPFTTHTRCFPCCCNSASTTSGATHCSRRRPRRLPCHTVYVIGVALWCTIRCPLLTGILSITRLLWLHRWLWLCMIICCWRCPRRLSSETIHIVSLAFCCAASYPLLAALRHRVSVVGHNCITTWLICTLIREASTPELHFHVRRG